MSAPRYLVHESETLDECASEPRPIFYVYARGQFDTDTLCGDCLATCDSGESAAMIAKALNQFNP